MELFGKQFKIAFASIFFVEMLSLFGYFFPALNNLFFIILALLFFCLAIYKFEYAILVLIAELFIGSKGYLFSLDILNISISIRIFFWLIIMSVWLGSLLITAIKNKKIEIAFIGSKYFYYYLALFVVIVFSLINGYLQNNLLSNVFFDANGWFYLLLIFPIYEMLFKNSNNTINNVLSVLSAAILWLVIKTLFFVYIFSHFSFDFIYPLYRWLRETGVGEVTLIQGGFYRVFFQSHIYLLIYFVLLLIYIVNQKYQNKKKKFIDCLLLFSILSVNLVNFSRSNWLGLVAGLLILFFIAIFNKQWLYILKSSKMLVLSLIASLIIIVTIVYFPLPKPLGGFNAANLLSDRATEIAGEAGASSRMALLPKLFDKIKTAPIFGKGFGATVTYQTSDPRILQQNPSGMYTTYAFEWGWLDIWLKFGILGLIIYLILLYKIYIKDNFENISKGKLDFDTKNWLIISLSIGIIIIAIVSIFSPYLNHPLGLGYLVITTAIIEKLRSSSKI